MAGRTATQRSPLSGGGRRGGSPPSARAADAASRGPDGCSPTYDGGIALMRQGPLAGRYPAAAAMVMFALIPYLALSAALQPLTPIIGHDLHMSPQAMSLGSGMANAAYAVGTVIAVQFAQLLRQRRMMVVYVALLVIGSVLAAAAQNPAMFIAGHVLQGLCTSLLLIAAVPPLALGFGVEKFRSTAVIMSMCIFGAVALGPAIGGIQAQANAWRPLFWVVAGISLAAFVLSLLTFEDTPPADRSAPKARGDRARGRGMCRRVLRRLRAAHPQVPRARDIRRPLVVGLALIVVLIVNQYRRKRPLLTIRSMLTSTIPVAGIVLALFAAAASVSATALTAACWRRATARCTSACCTCRSWPARSSRRSPLGVVMKQARAAVPPAGGHGLPRRRHRGVPHPAAAQPGAHAGRLRADRHRPRRDRRAGAVRRRLLAAGRQPAARVRDRRAAARGGGVHDRADVRALRRHRRRQPDRPAPASRCGSASDSRSAAPSSPVVLYVLGGARPQTPDLERFMDGEGPAWYSPPLLAGVRKRATGQRVAEEPGTVMSTSGPRGPVRSCSPTTAPSWPSTRSTRPARQLEAGRRRARRHRLAAVRRRVRARSAGCSSTRRRSPRSGAPPRTPPPTERRSPSRRGFRAQSDAIEAAPDLEGDRRTSPTSTTQPDRARLARPQRPRRRARRQRRRGRRRALAALGADRAPPQARVAATRHSEGPLWSFSRSSDHVAASWA